MACSRQDTSDIRYQFSKMVKNRKKFEQKHAWSHQESALQKKWISFVRGTEVH